MEGQKILYFLRQACRILSIVLLMLSSIPIAASIALALLFLDFIVSPMLAGIHPGKQQLPENPNTTSRPSTKRVEQPISVVIPTWNARELLDMSLPPLLDAIYNYEPGGEIIIIDNNSTDDTRSHLQEHFPQVRIIKMPRNEGFAKAANRGIIESQHPTVILLNNDMVVEKDFIFPLIEPFDKEPEVFGVSAQIYFIDKNKPRWETGKVHMCWELGSLSLFHLYRWDEQYVYPIAYAGGGASAYDRNKLLALGGFDEKIFEPIYIEDVDLGYRAWKRGWPSLFAPKSVVHHKHRSTSLRLWSEGAIYSFFLKNLAALVWKNMHDRSYLCRHLLGLVVLPHRAFKGFGVSCAAKTFWGLLRQIPKVMRGRVSENMAPRAMDDHAIMQASRYRFAYRSHFKRRTGGVHSDRKQMLVVSPFSPHPPVHGGAVRMFSLLKRLQHTVDIDLVTYVDTPDEMNKTSVAALEEICRHVALVERKEISPSGPLDPSQTHGFRSQQMTETIEYFLERYDYDIVQVEYTHMAHYMPPPANRMIRVLVEHDVSFVSLSRSRALLSGAAAKLANLYDWMRLLRYEISAVENAEIVVVMSEHDKAELGKFADTHSIHAIPNGVDCSQFSPQNDQREPGSILFVGFFRHEPNVQAVDYFCRDVLPLIRKDRPDVRLQIVGASPPVKIQQLANEPGIDVLGKVDDISAYYRKCAVFVAPILKGSGTRLKILEAMASGSPVVSTTVGAEGLDVRDGKHLLIGDTPEAMADAVKTLLSNQELTKSIAAQARKLVVARYDWDAIAAQLLSIYDAAEQW
jgi:O-antigen biosynthesis protein